MTAIKDLARDWIDQHRDTLSAWHRTIWEYAEPAWREYRSAAWFVDQLRRAGFSVEAGSGGMPEPDGGLGIVVRQRAASRI